MADRPDSLCTFGQYNLDVVSRATTDVPVFTVADNSLRLGGAVANVGGAARGWFSPVTGVFAVGNDLAGQLLREQAESLLDEAVVIVKDTAPTGIVVVRFVEGERQLVGPRTAASSELVPDDIRGEVADHLGASDVLLIDGYLLLGRDGPAVVRAAVAAGRHQGRLVVLDLVPHNIDSHIDLVPLRALLPEVDVVISEARTLAPVLGVGRGSVPGTVAGALRDVAHSTCLVLRHGADNIEYSEIFWPDGTVTDRAAAPLADLRTLGYGDRRLMGQLREILDARKDGAHV